MLNWWITLLIMIFPDSCSIGRDNRGPTRIWRQIQQNCKMLLARGPSTQQAKNMSSWVSDNDINKAA